MGSQRPNRLLVLASMLLAVPWACLATDWPETRSSQFTLDTAIDRLDADADGMEDSWESAHSLNPSLNDSALDPDGDGRSNWVEYNSGTHPQSADGIPVAGRSGSFALLLRTLAADADSDGLPDAWENANGLNPAMASGTNDVDGDGLSNLQEYNSGWNPQVKEVRAMLTANSLAFSLDSGGIRFTQVLDSDFDSMPDWWEVAHGLNRFLNDASDDLDGDGDSNLYEYQHGTLPELDDLAGGVYGISPYFLFDTAGLPPDADGDGIPDFWEIAHGLNPSLIDASGDPDGDGRSNLTEYNAGTDPQVDDWRGPRIVSSARFLLDTGGFNGGYAVDSDGDGMPDWWEIAHGLNPSGNDAAGNPDSDNLSNVQEYNAGTDPNVSDPLTIAVAASPHFPLSTVSDSDGDSVHDAWEIYYFGSPASCNPLGDADGDRLRNYQEFVAGTDPLDPGSLLMVGSQEVAQSGGMTLKWASTTNTLYIIERTASITAGFTNTVASGILATPPLNSWTDPSGTNRRPFYYRIRIQ